MHWYWAWARWTPGCATIMLLPFGIVTDPPRVCCIIPLIRPPRLFIIVIEPDMKRRMALDQKGIFKRLVVSIWIFYSTKLQ
jgi:hypothetical protein